MFVIIKPLIYRAPEYANIIDSLLSPGVRLNYSIFLCQPNFQSLTGGNLQ